MTDATQQITTGDGVPVTTHLLALALMRPQLFDQVYEATLAASRASRDGDAFSFVHRRMAEEIHFWRQRAAHDLTVKRLHLEAMRAGGVVADPGTPKEQVDEAERALHGDLYELRSVFDYTFLPTSMPSGSPIRAGDPVIDTEEDGDMLAADFVSDPALAVVGARVPLEPSSFVEVEGEPPPPAFITVRAAEDQLTIEQIHHTMSKAAEALKTAD